MLVLDNNNNTGFLISVFVLVILFLVLAPDSFSQWVNNTSTNTKLVIDASDPVNISSVEDFKGGAFIIWQDNKSGFQSEVYFLHVDETGKVSFRADGKRVTNLPGPKLSPVADHSLPNSAVIVWKDFTQKKNGDLYIQRVFANGNLAWNDAGARVTKTSYDISDYSVSSGPNGNAYISYLKKDPELLKESEVHIQKVSPNGNLLFKTDSLIVYKSNNNKSLTSVVADDKGGAYVFWLENQNNKSLLYAEYIDSTGKEPWGKKPMIVSSSSYSVLNYSVQLTNFSSVYAAWQIQKSNKAIYHQLISVDGKPLWGIGGKRVSSSKGSQLNPQVLTTDTTLTLCWTDDTGKDKDIVIQRYNQRGKALWSKEGVNVIDVKGDQFGQKIIPDENKGVIIGWIDRRIDTVLANIYAQHISSSGVLLWDSAGIEICSNNNTPKSYLSLISDGHGGVIAVFKNKRNGKNNIYGQKIFNTGTFVSQIVGFTSELNADSIKISWYTANESAGTIYNLERAVQTDTGGYRWTLLKSFKTNTKNDANYYEFYDKPDGAGTFYYRVTEKGNIQLSDVTRSNYFSSASKVTVAQNIPNPFSDSTTISFYLPKPAKVSIEFFNSHIELIKEIKNKTYRAGQSEVTFSAVGLKPGIYFYRFQVNDFVDVKKMVITN